MVPPPPPPKKGKKGKMSRKARLEMERQRKEEEERIHQEIEDRRELYRQKRHRRREKLDAARQEQETRRRMEQEQVIIQEREEVFSQEQERAFVLNDIRRRYLQSKEDRHHFECHRAPSMDDEVAVRAFVSKWEEECQSCDVSSPKMVLQDCAWIAEVIEEMSAAIVDITCRDHLVLEEEAGETSLDVPPISIEGETEGEGTGGDAETSPSLPPQDGEPDMGVEGEEASASSNGEVGEASTNPEGESVGVEEPNAGEGPSGVYCTPGQEAQETLDSSRATSKITRTLYRRIAPRNPMLTVLKTQRRLLGQHLVTLIDRLSAYLLLNKEKFQLPETTQIEISEGPIELAMWINVERSSLNKNLHIHNMGIACELPKALLRQAIALRFIRMPVDVVSDPDSSDGFDEFYPLGGILSVESLALPPTSTTSKGWVMQPLTDLCHTVQRQRYPPASALAGSSNLHMRISVTLPKTIMIRDEKPLVGWFLTPECQWSREDIADVMYEKSSHRMTFSTIHLTHMAALQEIAFDFPLSQWHIRPRGYSRASLNISGRRRWTVAEKEAEILIDEDGLASLLRPNDPEMQGLLHKPMPVSTLLFKMAQVGFNLMLTSRQASGLLDINPKKIQTEQSAHRKVAMVSSVFPIAHCPQDVSASGVPRDCLLARIHKTPTIEFSVSEANALDDASGYSEEDSLLDEAGSSRLEYHSEEEEGSFFGEEMIGPRASLPQVDRSTVRVSEKADVANKKNWELMVFFQDTCGYIEPTLPDAEESSDVEDDFIYVPPEPSNPSAGALAAATAAAAALAAEKEEKEQERLRKADQPPPQPALCFRPEASNGPDIHHSPYFCVRSKFGEDVGRLVNACSESYVEGMTQLLDMIRPFSFSQ